MRLRTRLTVQLGLAAVLAVAVTLFAWREVQSLSAAATSAARAQRVLADARALLGFTYEYALYGQARAAQQWRLSHAALVAGLAPEPAPRGAAASPDLSEELARQPDIFTRLEEARSRRPEDEVAARRAELLTDNLIASTQAVLDATYRWVEQLSDLRMQGERRLAAVAITALALLAAVIALIWRDLSVLVMQPLRRLQRVMTDVAEGDLQARSGLARADEIGELSTAFDTMTASLQTALAQRVASEQQLRLIAENLPVRIARFDVQQRFLFANTATCRMYGAASDAALLGRQLRELRGEEAYAPLAAPIAAVLKGQPQDFVIEEKLPGAAPRWSAVSLVPDQAEDASIRGWYSMILDITEATLNRRRVEQSLAEKEVLLREVHHRVKNNLQVVTSLLSLQARQANDPALREMFAESRDRIRSMALIHEMLYRSASFAAVDFGEYLRTLVSMISAAQRRSGVTTKLELEPVKLDIERAVPAALVVNELVSNSFKHGFPDGRPGSVEVSLGLVEGHRLRLTVCDDGVGAPGIDPEQATSLGLRLVRLLAAQLDATLTTLSTPGFRTVLEFAAADGPTEEDVHV